MKIDKMRWGMMRLLMAVAMATVGFSLMKAELPIAPHWSGEVVLNPDVKIKIRFNFQEVAPGQYAVTLDSPEQGVAGMQGVVNSLTANSFSVAVPQIGLEYAAQITDTPEGKRAKGMFRQITVNLPLTMEPGENKPNRPQTPEPPYPYTTREVTFANPDGTAVLAGTLTLPANYYEGTPVLLLITGSGLQNRDEEIFDHKPFAVIADYLARIGIATLRYDDRGFGESTGNGETATTFDFASDAKAGLKYLREVEKFKKAGVLGHSEGATIAFMLGNSDVKPDFIVAVAPPAVKGDKILEDQLQFALGQTDVKESLDKMKNSDSAWMRYFIAYDPAIDIKGTKCPVLAIFGGKDRQVSPALNKGPFEKLQPKATVMVYPEMNHLMQHSTTGSPDEYYRIEETFATEVLTDISRFILQHR